MIDGKDVSAMPVQSLIDARKWRKKQKSRMTQHDEKSGAAEQCNNEIK
jgi:hypothetical protein